MHASGKAVGIIKRVQTSSIDGWMIHKNGDDHLRLNRNDKDILSSLMKKGQWLSYEAIYGDATIYNFYSRLAGAFGVFVRPARGMESIFENCKNDVYRNIRRDLLCEPQDILRTSRHFVRCSYPAPPFCFETPIQYKLEPLLAFFSATCNPATGLPLPLDLTDQDVTIPEGFTREFVEEVEANLIKESELDKYEVENHFTSLHSTRKNKNKLINGIASLREED
jgi:hypothetical protein